MKKLSIFASAVVLAASASTSMAATYDVVGGTGDAVTMFNSPIGQFPIGDAQWTITPYSGVYDDVSGILNFEFSGVQTVPQLSPDPDAELEGTGVLDTVAGTFTVTFTSCQNGPSEICNGANLGNPDTMDSTTNININLAAGLITWSTSDDAQGTTTYTDWSAQVVPVPAAAWLFGSALLGLAGIGRRRAA